MKGFKFNMMAVGGVQVVMLLRRHVTKQTSFEIFKVFFVPKKKKSIKSRTPKMVSQLI